MRRPLHVSLSIALVMSALASSSGRAAGEEPAQIAPILDVQRHAADIDRFVDDKLREQNLDPLPIVDDEQFLRRLYLDVVGRIPTLAETRAFLDSKESDKRAKLITELINSPGHQSHAFNFWADILRIKDNDGGISRAFYMIWIRESLATNKPYDQFVRELVTASGSGWQRGNGAVGYYFRDRGMPLDNMANTLRIFTGTRVACAQCHDHPTDRWTRRDMFEMAAFTSNVKTENTDKKFKGIVQREKVTTDQELKGLSQIIRNTYHRDQVLGVSNGVIKLPNDYQYDDAKPGQRITAHPLFGPAELPGMEADIDYRQRFGRWLTSPDNPRFTMVIANRLWKRVMGRGLIEPVDDLRDDTVATHPELLEYLTKLMQELKYDMRAYMMVLYNTQTYQRQIDPQEPETGESNYFRGRLLSRMTAEQTWDSLMTLTVPEVDTRQSGLNTAAINYGGRRVLEGKQDMFSLYEATKDHSVDEHWEFVVSELSEIKNDLKSQQEAESTGEKPRKPIYDFMGRGAELSAPAPPGHFLRTFGQSNREFIDGGSTASNVTQFLSMFNGVVESSVLRNRNSILLQQLSAAKTSDEKIDVAYLSVLNRAPMTDERATLTAGLADGSLKVKDIVWVLLNSQEFLFVR